MRFSCNHPMTLEIFPREANTTATTTDVCEIFKFWHMLQKLTVLLLKP